MLEEERKLLEVSSALNEYKEKLEHLSSAEQEKKIAGNLKRYTIAKKPDLIYLSFSSTHKQNLRNQFGPVASLPATALTRLKSHHRQRNLRRRCSQMPSSASNQTRPRRRTPRAARKLRLKSSRRRPKWPLSWAFFRGWVSTAMAATVTSRIQVTRARTSWPALAYCRAPRGPLLPKMVSVKTSNEVDMDMVIACK